MTISIEVMGTGIDGVMQWLDVVRARLTNERDKALYRIVNAVASIWRQNYDQEGRLVGGWASLTESTMDDRARLGFNPAHPILYRYGNLRAVAVDFPATMSENSFKWAVMSDPDDGDTQATTFVTLAGQGFGTLSFSSVKAVHMYGNQRTGMPARPFWFVDDAVIVAGRDAVIKWIGDEVLNVP